MLDYNTFFPAAPYMPILSYGFPVTRMVFTHIHYNRYFELRAIIFVLSAFLSHKNMHIQKFVQLLGCISFFTANFF